MIKLIELLNEEEIDEYDVENEQDINEFIEFMEAYQKELNEADCDCMLEAKNQGRTVPLGKPMRGDMYHYTAFDMIKVIFFTNVTPPIILLAVALLGKKYKTFIYLIYIGYMRFFIFFK